MPSPTFPPAARNRPPGRIRRLPAGLLLLVLLPGLIVAGAAWAQEGERIVDIRIIGNDVTKARIIEQELAVGVGDVATGQALADSRQAVQDLGLFRNVEISQQPVDGGVALVVQVREKRYFLPIPRLDTSSDLDYTYGAQLRWSNVWGLNHRLTAYVEETKYRQDRNLDSSRSARVSYLAPYIAGSDYSLNVTAERTEQVTLNRRNPGPDGDNTFDETFQHFEILGLRSFNPTRPRVGWTLGTGLFWQQQETGGALAPPSDGTATAVVGIASYDDMRFNVYSNTGQHLDLRAELALNGVGSDYGYERLEATYRNYRAIGNTPHQTAHVIAAGGVLAGGPRSRNTFSMGGSSRMRGYDSDYIEGDSYWYLAGEYLRPVRWNWLRMLAVAEVGGARRNVFAAYPDRDQGERSLFASVGLGFRARITWFVDIDLELGVAMPLVDGDGLRFFARSL
ncbi:MAG: BamA/TamA family outer membrane protein [Xanthomonadales bacterium]|nr:BamA/TamA family outer membrane protein [Xanthomonadales bacterium]